MFKFLVISDTHFGFGKGTEREEDCWVTVEEAMKRAPELGVDFILVPGDMFDIKVPRPEDWSRALHIFSKSHVPVYAIHGNHERRGQNLTNPVEGLEKGDVLKYMHGKAEVFDIKGRKVAIYGLGWVPEAYSKQMFEQYNPQPTEGAYNIFVIHQSISPYIYNPMEPPAIDLKDLPRGFDLYINGHIHSFEQSSVHGKPFFIPGSSVTTQTNQKEASRQKGFVIVTVDEDTKIEHIPFETARRVFYEEIQINGDSPSAIQAKVEKFLDSIPGSNIKPLVRVKIKGKIPKGIATRDLKLREIKAKHDSKMILSIGADVEDEEFQSKRKIFESIQEQKLSIDQMGMQILQQTMKDMGSDLKFEKLFDYLADGDIDTVLTLVTE